MAPGDAKPPKNPPKPKLRKCTPQELDFLKHYLKSRNATDAYIKSGHSPKGASANACKLLKKPHIQKKLAELEPKAEARLEEKLVEKVAEEVLIDREYIHRHLKRTIELSGGHFTRGHADVVAALALASKITGEETRAELTVKRELDGGAAQPLTFGQQINIGMPTGAWAAPLPAPASMLMRLFIPEPTRRQLGIDSPASAAIEARFAAPPGSGDGAVDGGGGNPAGVGAEDQTAD